MARKTKNQQERRRFSNGFSKAARDLAGAAADGAVKSAVRLLKCLIVTFVLAGGSNSRETLQHWHCSCHLPTAAAEAQSEQNMQHQLCSTRR
jgi:hypothetical protein